MFSWEKGDSILPRKIPYLHLLAACALTTSLAVSSCYTLLKHPKVKRGAYEEVSDNRCNGCHYEDELWAYHHPPNHPSAYPSGWAQYYLVPWWYDAYWHFEPAEGTTIPVPARRIRPDADDHLATPGGAIAAPVSNVTSPATAEGQPDKGKNDDSSSKNRTVRPSSKKKDDKAKDKDNKDKG